MGGRRAHERARHPQPIQSGRRHPERLRRHHLPEGRRGPRDVRALGGADPWRIGLHTYLAAHRNGNATADDFLDAEASPPARTSKTAFHTFLDQAGLPFLEVERHVRQGQDGRLPRPPQAVAVLPAGSKGDSKRTWQLPVCLRTDLGTSCSLLTQPEADVAVGTAGQCPAVDVPQRGRRGLLPLRALRARPHEPPEERARQLTTREKIALGSSLRGGYSRATTP